MSIVSSVMGSATAVPFGELLKRHRMASGISQESLAEKARISTSAIGALERGARRAPYRDTVELLANALELSDPDRAELEAAAERARGRRVRAQSDLTAQENLPVRLTSFVGRDREIAEIEVLTLEHRLVTLTGSGGVGKTRTATEVARRLLGVHYQEAWFVDLSPIENGAFVAGTVASQLGIPADQAGASVAVLAARLKMRRMLLILDNCEHVIDATAHVAGAILRACPEITVLATSRERLAIEGEHVYRLPSLSVPMTNPATADEAREYASLRLVFERTKAIDPTFSFEGKGLSAGAEICRRLEGIPLALELVASRLPALGFAALNARLQEHFLTIGGSRDLPQRQQTMLATIAWSYDLLSGWERVLLARLTIFRGGFTLEAAEAICADDSLPAGAVAGFLTLLVDKSLLTVRSSGEQRRYALLESIRAFASEKLHDTNDFERTARAHAEWLAVIADRADARFQEISRTAWDVEYRPEFDNVRSALAWAASSTTEADALLAARIVGGLRGLWLGSERYAECRTWTGPLIERVDSQQHAAVAVRLMAAHVQAVRDPSIFAVAERAIALFERNGNRLLLMSLHAHLAYCYGERGDFVQAEESIARAFAIAEEDGLTHLARYVDLLLIRAGNRVRAERYDEARKDLADAVLRTDAESEDNHNANLYWQGIIEFAEGNLQRSADLHEAGLERRRRRSIEPRREAKYLAAVRLAMGDIVAAERAAREAVEFSVYDVDHVWSAIWHYAAVLARNGRLKLAARLSGFAMATCRRLEVKELVTERSSHDILMACLRDQLSPEEIEALQAEGARLDVVQAIDEALNAL